MTSTYRAPYLAVTLDGTALTDAFDARVQIGFDQAVARCDIAVTALPTNAAPWQVVTVSMGANAATAARRFTGYYLEHTTDLAPKRTVLHCRGYMALAEIYQSDDRVDMSGYSAALLEPGGAVPNPGGNYGYTDVEMIGSIFNIVGITVANGITTDLQGLPQIGGLDRILGLVSLGKGFKLEEGEPGLGFIQRLDEATGYRTYDTFDGTVTRRAISIEPGVFPDHTFTEHVDIVRASAEVSMSQIYNRIKVSGWTGDRVTREHTADAVSPWLLKNYGILPWYREKSYSSGMIERNASADSGKGLSAEEVAHRMLAENLPRRIHIPYTTHLDTVVVPNQTVEIISSTRLGWSQNFWVQAIDVSCGAGRGFSQTIDCIGIVAEPIGVVLP